MTELRELAYQQRVLQLLDSYLQELTEQKARTDKVEQANARENDPELRREPWDFPLKTWEGLKDAGKLPASREKIPYSPRKDGTGRPVPNVVYKVPTAGGKTFLAVSSLSRIFQQYLGKRTGFVLWIVPNEAIYSQTKKQLNNRRHPYRQLLDNLSGNAVKVMEKTTPLHAGDVQSNLCVMLLMLQAANRETKASLKMFQDRGDVHGFAPEEGNQRAHQQAVEAIPNLDMCDLGNSNYPWMPVRDSLGNALRVIRPVVVMDEGHKAVSDLAFKTLYGFNPSFVLELTATPKDVKARSGNSPRPARYQNLLAEVSGLELDREGMIKMPIHLDAHQRTDWQSTLHAGLERLNGLQEHAQQFAANTSRYIRPIMLVQVERTGKDTQDGRHIHAEDVKAWLTGAGRLDEAEVAIKTAEKNDLKSPENQDLLSKSNRVRVIITRQALQEGWDCPFAYVLCSLAASSNLSAMTQLMGRILRQPQAEKTTVKALNESYVLTHHAKTGEAVESIKKGLEEDGMGDLVHSISVEGPGGSGAAGAHSIARHPKFAKERIFLPKVLRVDGAVKRELDYDEDIVYPLDWSQVQADEFVQKVRKIDAAPQRQLNRVWIDRKTGKMRAKASYAGAAVEQQAFDCAYSTQFISDIVANSWQSRRLVGDVVSGLQKAGFNAQKLGKFASPISEQMRKWLIAKREAMAEARFRAEVQAGRIQFRLQTNGRIGDVNWAMPKTSRTRQPERADQLLGSDGGRLQRSLFRPQFKDDMNSEERDVAMYMDSNEALHWWHRNVSRNHYYLQGWRRDKIYPDFICSVKPGAEGNPKLCVLEMKGEHLAGNEDTLYKMAILKLLTENFSIERISQVGEVRLLADDGTSVRCDLVLLPQWQTELPKILS